MSKLIRWELREFELTGVSMIRACDEHGTHLATVLNLATEADKATMAAAPLMMEAMGVCKWLSLELDISDEGVAIIQEAVDAIEAINALRREDPNDI